MKNTFEFRDGDTVREIRMTFGLLTECAQHIGDVDRLPLIALDPELQISILNSLLSERDAEGKVVKPASLYQESLSPEMVGDILEWVGEHVADFLLRNIARMKSLLDTRKDQISSLTPS